MTIDIKEGRTIITLKEVQLNTTFCGDPQPSFEFTGELKLLENSSIAYSFLSDKYARRAMTLMFRYINLNYDLRHYIPAGMLTFSSNQIHEPLFQKMAVFRVRQDYTNPQTSELLHGILALNSAPLVLDNDTLEELRKDKNLAKLLSSDKAVFTNCSVFLESSIKSNAYFIQDEAEKMNLIFQLRQNSLYPSQEIVSEPEPFTDFIMHYQMHQKEYPEFVKNFKQQQKKENESKESASDTIKSRPTS